ncbi:MAG: hypothetical protein HF982_00425 [Desulfobacteraceae bacterium]|nr:hypothetical protein [Desulfobacteraceae bacterium]MBC2718066.1 hypothetical protein [Desulfobacteraceae bacterium]
MSYVRKSSIGPSGQRREKGKIIAGCGGLLQNRTESFQKPVSIGIVFKNVSSLDTLAYDMIQSIRRIYSGLTWHDFITTNKEQNAL